MTPHQQTLTPPEERKRHPAFNGRAYHKPALHVPATDPSKRIPLVPGEFCRATKRPRPYCCGYRYQCSELEDGECWKYDEKLTVSNSKPMRCDECKKEFGP